MLVPLVSLTLRSLERRDTGNPFFLLTKSERLAETIGQFPQLVLQTVITAISDKLVLQLGSCLLLLMLLCKSNGFFKRPRFKGYPITIRICASKVI